MAQSTESIETQPPPEVRPDKLQPDQNPREPEPQTQSQTQPQPPTHQLNGESASSSASVASTVRPSPSEFILANSSHGNGTQDNNRSVDPKTEKATTVPPENHNSTSSSADAGAPTVQSSLQSPLLSSTSQSQPYNDHGSQNGTRDSGTAALSPSPPMSGARSPPDGLPRQGHPAYSSPASYQPPPGMHLGAQYAYSAQVQQQPDPYRNSPAPINSSMALPSMRTFDHQQQQQQLQPPPLPPHPAQQTHGYAVGPHMAQQMGGPMAGQIPLPPQAGMGPGPGGMGYYPNALQPNQYSMQVDSNGVRYAILPEIDPRIILANRQKKEIKRRTKTGCLTCRKRRIKCDEAHPTCNNCKKSKRECLGYDPIFRQPATPGQAQTQAPAPVRIQPAPSPTNPNTTPPSGTPSLVSPPAATAATPTISLQNPVVPSTYPPTTEPLPASAGNSEGRYDHPGSIDPVLRGFDPTPRGYNPASRAQDTAPRPPETTLPSINDPGRSSEPSYRPAAEHPFAPRPSNSTGIPPSGPEIGSSNPGHSQHSQHPQHPPIPRVKMRVEELIDLGGTAPHSLGSAPDAQTVDEMVRLYYEIYVPGLDGFFETQWYDFENDNYPGVKNPLSIFRLNKRVLDTFAAFLRAISDIKTADPAKMVYSGHLETCLVWELARLSYAAAYGTPARSPSVTIPPEDDPTELRCRLQVFETLLTGDTLTSNPLTAPPPPSTDNNVNPARIHELEFWYRLAQYLLQAHSSPIQAHAAAREQCLSRMRSVLDGRENRDVIYSIAVLREYTMVFDAADTERTAPAHLDEMDPRSKLAVATRFIQDEAAKNGTTNVVRRFADLAYRAYVRPGSNVRRL